MMFDSFEAYDVQETRRISRAEGKIEGRAEGKIEGKAEGRIEGKAEGRIVTVITQTLKKLAKNYSVPEIADMLEEDEALIRCISDIKKAHPDSNEEEIWELLCKKQEKEGNREFHEQRNRKQ